MSPEEIAQEKKRMIFRFLQDELEQNRDYEDPEKEVEHTDDEQRDVFDSESEREEAREQEYRNTHHLEERIQPGANEEQFRTFEVNLE